MTIPEIPDKLVHISLPYSERLDQRKLGTYVSSLIERLEKVWSKPGHWSSVGQK